MGAYMLSQNCLKASVGAATVNPTNTSALALVYSTSLPRVGTM